MPDRPLHDAPPDRSPEREPQPRIPMPAGLLPTLYEILDAAILVLHGKFGTIQLYDPTRRVLELTCQRGFSGEFLDAMASVSIDTAMAAPRSIRNRERVVVTDVNADPDYAPYRELAANAGYRAISRRRWYLATAKCSGRWLRIFPTRARSRRTSCKCWTCIRVRPRTRSFEHAWSATWPPLAAGSSPHCASERWACTSGT